MKTLSSIFFLFSIFSCENEIETEYIGISETNQLKNIEQHFSSPILKKRAYGIIEVYSDKTPNKVGMKGDITKYTFNEHILYFGYDIDWNFLIQVEDQFGNIQSTYKDSISDSQIFNPTFFSTNKAIDPLIILVELGGYGESWGNLVLIEHQGGFKKIGFIDVSTHYNKNNFEIADNIAPHTKIHLNKSDISFNFSIEEIYYCPNNVSGALKEEFFGEGLTFLYKEGEFRMIRNEN